MNSWWRIIGRLGIGAIFLYAGSAKIAAPVEFEQSINSFGIIQPPLSTLVALYLPALEVAAAIALQIPRFAAEAAMLLAGLCAVFCAVLIAAWIQGRPIDCGCFGSGGETTSHPWALGRNVALLAALAVAIPWRATQQKQNQIPPSRA